MDVFGLGLVFALILGLGLIVPAIFILVVAFVYVRQQRGVTVDINTGLSAYSLILIAVGALLLTIGVGQFLTAIIAEIDADYTYGVPSLAVDPFQDSQDLGPSTDDRQEQNVATGLALFIAGALAIAVHIGLRGWLAGEGRFDRGVEGAWDTFYAIVIALIALLFVAQMLNATLGRAIVDNEGTAAGATIAQTIAFLGLWLVYAWRAVQHVGFFARPRPGGPGAGEQI